MGPIVVINKVDRQDARPVEVHSEVFDLFAALDASEDQLDFPCMFASGRSGWADDSLEGPRKDLAPLFDLNVKHVPAPTVENGRASSRERGWQYVLIPVVAVSLKKKLSDVHLNKNEVKI